MRWVCGARLLETEYHYHATMVLLSLKYTALYALCMFVVEGHGQGKSLCPLGVLLPNSSFLRVARRRVHC